MSLRSQRNLISPLLRANLFGVALLMLTGCTKSETIPATDLTIFQNTIAFTIAGGKSYNDCVITLNGTWRLWNQRFEPGKNAFLLGVFTNKSGEYLKPAQHRVQDVLLQCFKPSATAGFSR